MRRALSLASGTVLLLGLSGCPVTDDYYLLPEAGPAGGGAASGSGGDVATSGTGSGAGGATAGSATGGSAAGNGGSGDGGAPDGIQGGAGASGAGGEGGMPCVASTERCNGHDDDCDGVVDEFACLSSCSGFVLPSSPSHGYMFCTSARKANWDTAKKACEDQDMHLAWLDSAEENAAVASKLASLGSDAEVLFGATDQGNEGDWIWIGGEQFWKGSNIGAPVAGRFSNWATGTPNNGMYNEDCALIMLASGKWGDRACFATYPFVCEQPD